MKIVIDGEAVEIPGGGSGGVTMEEVNAAIDAELGAYTPQDVYSTEETRIGTWIDGKPIYRSVLLYDFNRQSNSMSVNIDISALNVDKVVTLRATTYTDIQGQYFYVSGHCEGASNYFTTFFGDGKIYLKCAYIGAQIQRIFVIFEYTKTTDQATVAVSVSTAEESANLAMDMSAVPAVPMPVTSAAFGPDEED